MHSVPKIDVLAGIECYCTDFDGIAGAIKREPHGFLVSEIASPALLDRISKCYDEYHRYPLYLLEKSGIDSNHALIELENEKGLSLKIMGIKDAKARTTQYASAVRPGSVAENFIQTRHSILTLCGYTSKPVGKDQLLGNSFTIELYGSGTFSSSQNLDGFISEIGKIANFYGLQRFGSERLVSHLVGKELVRRDFKNAVELLLTYTTQYDSTFSKEIRNEMREPANYPRLVRKIPRGMDIEKRLISSLVAGKDPKAALRAIPITMRRLFVQAYQAFIFNKCLSKCLTSGEDITRPRDGDLVFEMEGEFTFGKVAKYQLGETKPVVPAITLTGYSFRERPGRFEQITNEILKDEGVSPKDFYIKEMDELSQQGGFRQAPLWCKGFSYLKDPLVVSFKLPKGSYATTLLREIMKPADPIGSGF